MEQAAEPQQINAATTKEVFVALENINPAQKAAELGLTYQKPIPASPTEAQQAGTVQSANRSVVPYRISLYILRDMKPHITLLLQQHVSVITEVKL